MITRASDDVRVDRFGFVGSYWNSAVDFDKITSSLGKLQKRGHSVSTLLRMILVSTKWPTSRRRNTTVETWEIGSDDLADRLTNLPQHRPAGAPTKILQASSAPEERVGDFEGGRPGTHCPRMTIERKSRTGQADVIRFLFLPLPISYAGMGDRRLAMSTIDF